jgi:hypothetical protein
LEWTAIWPYPALAIFSLLSHCSTLNTPNEDEEMCTGETVRKTSIERITLGWGARTFARRELAVAAISLIGLS